MSYLHGNVMGEYSVENRKKRVDDSKKEEEYRQIGGAERRRRWQKQGMNDGQLLLRLLLLH